MAQISIPIKVKMERSVSKGASVGIHNCPHCQENSEFNLTRIMQKPVSSLGKGTRYNPIADSMIVCSNCSAYWQLFEVEYNRIVQEQKEQPEVAYRSVEESIHRSQKRVFAPQADETVNQAMRRLAGPKYDKARKRTLLTIIGIIFGVVLEIVGFIVKNTGLELMGGFLLLIAGICFRVCCELTNPYTVLKATIKNEMRKKASTKV